MASADIDSRRHAQPQYMNIASGVAGMDSQSCYDCVSYSFSAFMLRNSLRTQLNLLCETAG